MVALHQKKESPEKQKALELQLDEYDNEEKELSVWTRSLWKDREKIEHNNNFSSNKILIMVTDRVPITDWKRCLLAMSYGNKVMRNLVFGKGKQTSTISA